MKAFICDRCKKVVKMEFDKLQRMKNIGNTIFEMKVFDKAQRLGGKSLSWHLCKDCKEDFMRERNKK